MQAAIQEWLNVIDTYYLNDFIPAGGSAFKLLLTQAEEDSCAALAGLRSLAERRGQIYAQVSASETRVDRIERFFFSIARQINWDSLIAQDAASFLQERDYVLPQGVSLNDTAAIAEANGCAPDELHKELRRATTQEIIKDRHMCKEFRTALAQLRNAQFFPRSITPSDAQTLEGWLRGEKVSLAALRDLRIHSKIARHNARDMLRALGHWLAKRGGGIVIGLDLAGLLDARPRGIGDDPSAVRYSRNALLDAYEVLREFIDETDEMSHCLICAVAPAAIETDEKRSLYKYYALQNRLINEVHDRDRPNLLASMFRSGGIAAVRGVQNGQRF